MTKLFYAAWRLDMWMKGYGSYTEIDAAVESGELMPGAEYPDKHATESQPGQPDGPCTQVEPDSRTGRCRTLSSE